MRWLSWLERRFGSWAIPRLPLGIVAVQAAMYLAARSGLVEPAAMVLVADRVLAGEWHRLLTFVFLPPAAHPLFALFALYLFFRMGSALEERWGAFPFNVFLLSGYLATVAAAFLFARHEPATNLFLGGSVFLAFAILHPDFELALFLVLPVKIKWLAVLTGLMYGFRLAAGPGSDRALVLASGLNLLLFFGPELPGRALAWRRRAVFARGARDRERAPFHRCAVCGRTERTDPGLDFVYVPADGGARCLCRDHLPPGGAGTGPRGP